MDEHAFSMFCYTRKNSNTTLANLHIRLLPRRTNSYAFRLNIVSLFGAHAHARIDIENVRRANVWKPDRRNRNAGDRPRSTLALVAHTHQTRERTFPPFGGGPVGGGGGGGVRWCVREVWPGLSICTRTHTQIYVHYVRIIHRIFGAWSACVVQMYFSPNNRHRQREK